MAFPAALLFALCCCAVGPDYKRPDATDLTPAGWRWKPAEPEDEAPKGPWWTIFRDAVLDGLESDAVAGNPNARAAMARVDQARAAARIPRSRLFPELSFGPSLRRERTSGNSPTPIPLDVPSAHLTTYSVPLDMSYEVDLWGRVRRSVEAAQAQADARVSEYHNVLLTLTADVAVNYFLVRSLDAEIAALQRTAALHGETARILEVRFTQGVLPESDFAQAKTELASTKTELADAARRRAETIHALALLCGKPASSFDIAVRPDVPSPPAVPAGLPSSLLERRPDIARAERTLAARNAQIGVARAAYFPALRLTGQAGFLSDEAGRLFSADSRVWSIGPSLSLPLFTAGRTAAEVSQAEAAYEEALAEYRQAVLAAFRDVEDALAQIVLWNEQAVAQAEALASAGRVAAMAKARYEAGAVSYLEPVDAERNLLRQERRQAELTGRRLAARVRLIKALGGGWDAAETGISGPTGR